MTDKKLILLIEDDYALALGTEYSLKSENYDVITAGSVMSARETIEKKGKDISLILLDVMLPDGNGYELCKDLRNNGIFTPIIFLTAVSDEANIVQGLELGADDYISKPFRVRELISRIKVLFRRMELYSDTDKPVDNEQNEKNNKLIIFNGYTLDIMNYRLSKDDTIIDCTPSEIKLLKELVLHSNMVLTRAYLTEVLWDVDGRFIDDNTLSVYMKRLRDKLPDMKDTIRTIRGVGYEFKDDNGGMYAPQ